MKYASIILLLFIFTNSFSQQDGEESVYYSWPKNPYHTIDSLAKTVEYKGDIRLLSYDLTKNYTTELDKARAIFIWVTENIAYDYKVLNKKKQKGIAFKCKEKTDCDAQYIKWEDDYLKKVISKQKGVCEGYSRLFKKLCDHAGIQGGVVTGYTKDRPEEIGKMGELNHAWNVMLVDGKYYYLDATWAAGGCYTNDKGKYKGFVKNFKEYYWLTPLEKLSRDHFPSDSVWIRNASYKKAKKTYKETAFIEAHEMPYLDLLLPDTGIVNACKGDTIQFRLKYSSSLLDKIQVNTNLFTNPDIHHWTTDEEYDQLLKLQQYVAYKTEDDTYTFSYIADNQKLKYIDVLLDYRRVLRIKVNMLK
jgi:hypothetical protein